MTTLLVWDQESSPPSGDWTIVFWRNLENGAFTNAVYIPRLVETHAQELRARYLAWIHELGETNIKGRCLADHLKIREGLSYWWMTLLTEKCNYSKSPQIDEVIRLMAFEKWASARAHCDMVLVSSNEALAESLRSLCERTGVEFEWRRVPKSVVRVSWMKVAFQAIPQPIQVIAWLTRYLIRRWPLKGVGVKEWGRANGRITFASYLSNLKPQAANEGQFESLFWGTLPRTLLTERCSTNWLHFYVEHALLPTATKASQVIRQFNATAQDTQRHVTLDGFLGFGVLFKVLRDWAALRRIVKELGSISLPSSDTAVDPWPLLERDWFLSFSGIGFLNNLLQCNLLEAALAQLPRQDVGVYLQENQSWEFAFISAWRESGHGCLIGAPHSTVRYWDLRYFFDPRSYQRTGKHCLPLPDYVAVNGRAALDAYLEGGYPKSDLVEVEALRYLDLALIKRDGQLFPPQVDPVLRLLVLGEYLLKNTSHQLRLLEAAAKSFPLKMVVTMKPHPACPVEPAHYPGLMMKVTTAPIAELLLECDVAYTSAVTSAAVDAYCVGVPVVCVLDPTSLNLNPLRGRRDVLFATTAAELSSALILAASTPMSSAEQQDFFILDFKLPRWRKLLSEATK